MRIHRILALLFFGFVTATSAPAAVSSEEAVLTETVVAGGPDDSLTVRHLRLRGSQVEIGRELARMAVQRWDVAPWPSRDRDVTAVQLRYLQKYWPAHFRRMQGSAEVLEGDLEDPGLDYSTLTFNTGDFFGCSVVYYPPEWTASGSGVMSRNLDFTTGTLLGRKPGPDGVASLSEPFVVECYPDEGYASLFVCSMDLLGSAFDGVNEKGLTAALLTDRELMNDFPMEPTRGLSVGLNEIQTVRFLLETCADVQEARQVLLEVKQYYGFVPCHFLVADAQGESFIYEQAASRNAQYFIEDPGEPLITTNFMRHRHEDLDSLEPTGNPAASIDRFLTMRREIEEADFPLEHETLLTVHRAVACTSPAPPQQVPWAAHRTIWHALYYPEQARLEIDFYLGEQPDPDAAGGTSIRRSGYLEFKLDRR